MSVYFVTCRAMGVVKIGNSLSPHERLPEIQVGCPHPLKLEGMLPGNAPEEHALHVRFAEYRMQGEWFTLIPEIEQLIASNPPAPKPTREKNTPQRREPAGGPWRRGELPREREARIAAEAEAVRIAAWQEWINKLEAAGEIHFPFRRLAELEDVA